MNAYRMLEDLRDNCGEATAAHWDDAELLRKLNAAQRRIFFKVSMVPGDWLVKSATLTPSASLITLPGDCAKPVYLEEVSSGRPININSNIRNRRVARPIGTTLYGGHIEAYLLKDYIEINMDSYTESCELWYQQRVVDLHAGTAGASSGAAALHLAAANEPNVNDDYYNNQTVEIVSGTGSPDTDTITDYDGGTQVAVVTGTFDNTSVYGTVSILPEECHDLIVLLATKIALAKPSSAIDPKYFMFFQQEYRYAEKDFREWIATRLENSQRTRITSMDI